MAGVPQKTLSWLYDVLKREYRDPGRTYSDLAQTLNLYPSLAPRTDVYVYENGAPALLVHFMGTIPVNFRGTTYRFPIAIWVPHIYPHDAPMIYVTPTEDMVVRPGQHVAGDGRVYHPYLARWRDAWDRSNVVDFLSILSDVFAKEPPVMSKPLQERISAPTHSAPTHSAPTHSTPPPIPPLPRELQRPPSTQTPPASPHTAPPAPPPPPPKPPAEGPDPASPPVPQLGRYYASPTLPPQTEGPGRPSPGAKQNPYGNGNVEGGMQYVPRRSSSLRQSIPPQQEYSQSIPPQAQAQQAQAHQSQPPRMQGPPQPPQNQPNQPFSQIPGPMQQQRPLSQRPDRPYPQQYLPGYPPPAAVRGYAMPEQAGRLPQIQQQQQQQRPLAAKPPPPPNLLDSPFDIPLPVTVTNTPASAPPIPRNPEKDALLAHLSHLLTQSLHTQIQQSTNALPALQSQHSAMVNTLSTLQLELQNLTSLHSTVTSNLNLLRASLNKSDAVISDAATRSAQGDIPRVDDMLVPPTVVAKQLYDNACEERGIESAIFALQEAFVRGRVGSEVWARRTRELAREGFRRRWMVRKVGRGMGLDLDLDPKEQSGGGGW